MTDCQDEGETLESTAELQKLVADLELIAEWFEHRANFPFDEYGPQSVRQAFADNHRDRAKIIRQAIIELKPMAGLPDA